MLDLSTTTYLVLEDPALHNYIKLKKMFMNGRLGDKMRSNFLQLQFVETNSINLWSLVKPVVVAEWSKSPRLKFK